MTANAHPAGSPILRATPANGPFAPDAADAWIGEDKLRHFFMSFAVTTFSYAGGRSAGASHDAALAGAGAIAAAAGIGKELYDHRHGGPFSVRDLTWDAAGIALGLLLAGAVR